MGVLPEKPWPTAEIYLGLLSTALLVVAVVGYFGDEEEGVTGWLLAAGVLLASLAAFFRRIEGVLKITKEGAEIPIGEYQAQRGQIVPAPKLELPFGGEGKLTAEIEKSEMPALTTGDQQKQLGTGADVGRDATPSVVFTSQAGEQYNQLTLPRKLAVDAAVETLGQVRDPKFITSANTGGRAYSRRRLPDQNLQLIYRMLDKTRTDEPDRYVVIAIEDIK
ncbi:hypothetical protein [Mycolicibacterium monacense]|uniref:Transmembrane protein n=1 Tax=Mycolicibacterium monacense TaxID=85693 RepID=A0AAD1IXY6_MYCMB|nr:hypothetical protein [Mycolicibacterium monacense]MDA4099969.1 hypothetical protein [Mycolicibacterium monacense DSM 44395]ORB11943.1 hypothetical protein BST34_28095 [Mycolicibacterium monacense DSM 44395]QHP84274.1 hypothetical protein EWR22_02245 [Mycolicibacterium monacense DSM 44395]BBZ62981.1 hypothetical protein MMON_42820 [Mycolicibacterium monacense]